MSVDRRRVEAAVEAYRTGHYRAGQARTHVEMAELMLARSDEAVGDVVPREEYERLQRRLERAERDRDAFLERADCTEAAYGSQLDRAEQYLAEIAQLRTSRGAADALAKAAQHAVDIARQFGSGFGRLPEYAQRLDDALAAYRRATGGER